MDKFITTTKIQQNKYFNGQQIGIENVTGTKYTLPSFTQLIADIKCKDHALYLDTVGQKHLVFTTKGLLCYAPPMDDASYIMTRAQREIMDKNILRTFEETRRERTFNITGEQKLLTWNDGAAGIARGLIDDIVLCLNGLNSIFKSESEQVTFELRKQLQESETRDFLKMVKFATVGFLLHLKHMNRTRVSLPISIYQFAVARDFPAMLMCHGQFYRESDALTWPQIKLNDIITIATVGPHEVIESLRLLLTSSTVRYLTGGAIVAMMPETISKKATTWSTLERTVNPISIDDED